MRTRLLATSVAVLLALTLAGCSDDPQPIIEPAPSPTAAPSVTPNETPSSTPTPTAEPESESAKDFIRRWQTAAFAMQTSGETDTYRSMTLACESCESFIDTVDNIYADGGSIRLDEPSVSAIRKVGDSNDTLVYEFDTMTSQTRVLDKDGSVVQLLEGGRSRYQVNLLRTPGGEWAISRISELVP